MDCTLPGFSVQGIFQQEYWSQLPFSPQGDLPNPGIKPISLVSPALAGGFLTTEAPGDFSQVFLLSGLPYSQLKNKGVRSEQ